MSTLGYQERHDVVGAVNYALDQEHSARPVILWGVSLGAASALMAAADSPQVAAVISDSSFLSLEHVITHHWHLIFPHIPAFPIANEIAWGIAWRGGFKVSDFNLEKAVERIGNRSILFVAVQGDRRMLPAYARKLFDDAKSPLKKLIVVPGHRHGEGFHSGHEQYEKAVADFLASLPVETPNTR